LQEDLNQRIGIIPLLFHMLSCDQQQEKINDYPNFAPLFINDGYACISVACKEPSLAKNSKIHYIIYYEKIVGEGAIKIDDLSTV
jgi:hypothetical protein